MKHLLPALLFTLFAGCVSAQSAGNIKGRITGEDHPLEFATVSLLKTNFHTTTDSLGTFSFTVPEGKYQLRVSYIGFENYQAEVEVQQNTLQKLEISLVPLTAKLKEIVVTGSLKEATKLQSVTPVDVYNITYFKRNPVTNLFDGLYSIPGLFADVDNGVSNTTDVQINGLEGNYTMYLIDGVPALSGLAGIYALNAFPISIVDKIEVVKGSSSTLYGSEAIAGVINIKTRNPNNIPRFSMNAQLTSMLEASADFSVRYKLGRKVNAMFAAAAESFNYRWDLDNDGFMDIPLVNRVNVYNKWAFKRQDDGIANIYARYLFEDRLGGETRLASKWRGSREIYGEAITTHQWQAGFQYQFPLKSKEKLLLAGDYSEHRQLAYYGFNKYNGRQVSGFGQLTWNRKLDSINEVLMGISYRLNHFKDNTPLSGTLTRYPNTLHIAALFFEDEISFAKWHKILLGIRLEYSNRSNFIALPRLGYKWNSKTNNDIIRFGAGMGYRVPNVINEGIGAMNGSRSIEVEEDLKPETTINGNLNYMRVQRFKGGLVNIDVSGFYTYFFNFVEPDYDDDPELIVYENSAGAVAAGFSINADFTFNYPLKIGVGLIYTNVYELEEGDDGEMEKEVPEHQPPFVATFYLSYNFPAPQLSIDWTGNLVTPMKLATVPDDERPEKSPVYSIQNIQLTKRFKKGVELYLGIKNIFNFIQKDPILRPFDPFNRNTAIDNPNNYRFDTTYGFTTTQGIKAFIGFRYTIQ